MTAQSCTGCAQAQRRFRGTVPRLYCLRFQKPAVARCIDYRAKADAIAAAHNFIARLAIK